MTTFMLTSRSAVRRAASVTLLAAAMGLLATPTASAVDDKSTADAPASTIAEFPSEWFWGNEAQRRAHDALVGKRPPALMVSRWIGEAQTLADLRGKVVVIDFWATWCGPCIRAMPMNKRLVEEHGDDGFVFIGIHDSRRGLDRLDRVMSEHKVAYPVAVDDAGKSVRAFKVAFWPTYAVIDREGNVRAVGLKPDHVPSVVATLMAEPVPADVQDRAAPPKDSKDSKESQDSAGIGVDRPLTFASPLPEDWVERLPEMRRDLMRLAGKPAPPLPDGTWMNVESLSLSDLHGKVVLLDFWATWCAPCIKAIPDLNRLQDRHKREGLVVIGICHGRGAETMAEVARRHGIRYPIVSDPELTAVKAYRVDTYPDYYLIDRKGILRGVDLRTESLEAAIDMLLAER